MRGPALERSGMWQESPGQDGCPRPPYRERRPAAPRRAPPARSRFETTAAAWPTRTSRPSVHGMPQPPGGRDRRGRFRARTAGRSAPTPPRPHPPGAPPRACPAGWRSPPRPRAERFPKGPASAGEGRPAARSARRLRAPAPTTSTAASPKATRAAAAAPPAPRTNTASGTRHLTGGRPRAVTSVFQPTRTPWRIASVFTAPPRAASGSSRSQQRGRDRLVRHGHVGPVELPDARSRRTARTTPAASTRRASYSPVMPAAARAARWIAGDREWPTGPPSSTSLTVVGSRLLLEPEELVEVGGERELARSSIASTKYR